MRFNHMELTFPVGSLTTALREEIDGFYGSIFGSPAVDRVGRTLTADGFHTESITPFGGVNTVSTWTR